jgi:tetratricopeptide (TPR) repeat protein
MINRQCISRLAVLTAIGLITGCSRDETVEFEVNKSLRTKPAEIETAAVDNSTDSEPAELVARWTKRAQQLESEFRFKEAVAVWRNALAAIENMNGEGSWQSINARAIIDDAIRKSKFSPGEINALRELENMKSRCESYVAASNPDAAEQTARAILAFQERLFGKQSLVVARTLVQLASLENEIGDAKNAIANFHRAVRTFRDLGIDVSPEIEFAHTGLAALYSQSKQWSPAIANQKIATRIASQMWGDASLQYAEQANQLGVLYHRARELKTAYNVLSASGAIRRRLLAPDDPQVGHNLLNLGIVALDAGNHSLAEDHLREALAIIEKQLGDRHPMALLCHSHLATVHMSLKQPEKAEPHLEQILTVLRRSPNITFQELAEHEYRLAICLAKQGKYDRAETFLRSLLKSQESELSPNHPSTVRSMQALALLLKSTGRQSDAEVVDSQVRQAKFESDSNDFNPAIQVDLSSPGQR